MPVEMSFSSLLRMIIGIAAAAALLCGCHRIPLYRDPTSNQPASPPPLALYTVDWWVPLVLPTSWDYLPREVASPAADPNGGHIIVLTRDKRVRGVSEEGTVDWSFETKGHFNASASVTDGIAYVPGGDGILYALRADSGQLMWQYDAGDELMTKPSIAGGKVLVATQGDTLVAVDQKSGQMSWRYRRESASGYTVRGASSPQVREGTAYVGFSDGALVALNLEDGSLKWEKNLSTPGKQFKDVDTTPVFDDAGRLFAASYKDGIYALEASSGAVEWHTARPGINSLLLRGEVLFAGGDQQLGAIFGENGRSVWSLDLGTRAARAPVLARGLLIVPTSGPLVFVDPISGRARSFWNPGKGVSATPLWNRSRLYVLSNLGYLYAIRLHGRGG